MFKLVLEKAEEPEIKLPTSARSCKMGLIKDRKGMDLREAEDIKERWQEQAENCTKKDLHDTDNHYGVITHLEPDILEKAREFQKKTSISALFTMPKPLTV